MQAFIDFNHLLHSGPACLSFVKHTSCVLFEALFLKCGCKNCKVISVSDFTECVEGFFFPNEND